MSASEAQLEAMDEQAAVDYLNSGRADATPGEDTREGNVTPGTALAVPFTQAELDTMLAPYQVDFRAWLTTLLSGAEFPEADAEESAMGMLAQILTAGDVDEMFAAMQMERAKAMCGNEPGGRSCVMDITAARPLKSTFEEGPGCFVIISAVEVASGRKFQFTTGARAVQASVAMAMHKGWLPLRCVLTIRRQATQRGFYPLNLEAAG
jgi:hypothetical protein